MEPMTNYDLSGYFATFIVQNNSNGLVHTCKQENSSPNSQELLHFIILSIDHAYWFIKLAKTN